MNTWTSGYVADIGYTFGYYTQLNPLRSRLPLIRSGMVCPEFGTACELGFGQGVSTNIHAAASDCKWYGTDFNPSQAGYAQESAKVSGNGAELFDEAFVDFCRRDDLPDFDFIGVHGIWSWISDENRAIIVEFIRRKLKVGGVLYISYNTMPGWAAFAPMRKLMTQHAEIVGSNGSGIVNQINGALDFADKLLATNPSYLKANPQVADRIAKLKTQNRQYLAHEFFNRDWHPVPFLEMAEALESAKLDYACSADYISHIDQINFSNEQLEFLNQIPDSLLRQSVRDFMINQQFRQDYWVKGVRKSHRLTNFEELKAEKIVLTNFREDIPLKVTCPMGEANLNEGIYNVVLDYLSDYMVHTVDDLIKSAEAKGVNVAQVSESLMTLAHGGNLMSVKQGEVSKSSIKASHKLNNHLMKQARNSTSDINNLASPLTGGGVPVDRVQQIFLLAMQQGCSTASEIANFTWQILDSQGEKVLRDGKAIESAEENISGLEKTAADFVTKRVPILRTLMVIPEV